MRREVVAEVRVPLLLLVALVDDVEVDGLEVNEVLVDEVFVLYKN